MKIESSNMTLTSQHTRVDQVSVEASLRAWVGNQRPDFEGVQRTAEQNGPRSSLAVSSASVSISEAARQAVALSQEAIAADVESVDAEADVIESDPKLKLLITLIEAYTGKKFVRINAAELTRAGNTSAVETAAAAAASAQSAGAGEMTQPQGWGLEYDRRESVYESEQTAFAAEGVIRTTDGKSLQFSVSLQMTREFASESTVSLRAGDAVRKDPLVINFGGTAAQLTDRKFAFDIDSDGAPDNVSFVTSASGFLALDKNGNGTIDNGTELFGAQSGDGFADLAVHDDDGNGWIDESDRVFAQLLIWTKDGEGNDQFETLAQRKVGALYLGQTTTPFDLKGAGNVMHGQVRSTGLYLDEQARVGTLQQVDLVV